MRCLSRFEHIDCLSSVSQRPVIMFSRSIHPCKRFLMEQTFHSVPALPPVSKSASRSDYGLAAIFDFCIDRSKLMLSRRRLVMLSFRRNAYLPKFFVHIFHKRCDSLSDRSEIVIVHLLTLRRHRAEQRPSCKGQILPLQKLLITLPENTPAPLPRKASLSLAVVSPNKAEQTQRLRIDSLHGTQAAVVF